MNFDFELQVINYKRLYYVNKLAESLCDSIQKIGL